MKPRNKKKLGKPASEFRTVPVRLSTDEVKDLEDAAIHHEVNYISHMGRAIILSFLEEFNKSRLKKAKK